MADVVLNRLAIGRRN